MDRRRFIINITGIIAATPLALHQTQAASLPTDAIIAGLSVTQWQTIADVQEHLFPNEADSLHNTPGAKDLNSTAYLQSVLNEHRHDPADKNFLLQGLTQLKTITQNEFSKSFAQLSHQQRDTALRSLEQTPDGRNWISMLLEYIMEALLSDPIYGGNPNSIGWTWLQHQPGFPRPPRILN